MGFGLGLAPAFFHDFNHAGTTQKDLTIEEFLEYPPSATTGFGLYTTNGTWLAGAAHKGNYKQDRIRYTGALAYTSLDLKSYVLDNPLKFGMKGFFTLQDVRFRLGATKWFLGYGQTWSDVRILDSGDLILAAGAGIRFNIAPKLKFRTGIDIARGPEDWTIYLQFGHAWAF